MTLPEYEPVTFKKAPLKQVIGQVRFPVLPRFGDGNFIAPFQEALQTSYPSASREESVTLRVAAGESVQSTKVETLWRFSTRDRKWSVVLGEAALTLEVPGYTSIDEFLERFASALNSVQKHLRVSDRTRLGLRYINEIRHPQGRNLRAWGSLLRPDFVGFAGSDLLGGTVEESRHELRVQQQNGVLVVRHGLVGRLIPTEDAPDAEDRFYLIDLDYFDTTEADLDTDKIIEQMRTYNDFIYRFFRWTLSDDLYNYLDPLGNANDDS